MNHSGIRPAKSRRPAIKRVVLLALLPSVALTPVGFGTPNHSDRPGRPLASIRTQSSSLIPSSAQSALALAERAGTPVQTYAFTFQGEFVIVAANRPLYSPGFPAPVRTAIDGFVRAKKTIDVVALGSRGQWLVIAGTEFAEANLAPTARTRVAGLLQAGRPIDSFAFSQTDGAGWVLTSAGSAYSSGRLPSGMAEAIAAAQTSQRRIHDISMSFQTHWAVVADDWYATGGLGADLLGAMDTYRTTDRRRIDHVVFSLSGGNRVGWSIISNGAEAVGSTRMARIENQLTAANQTIYQRMKNYGVPGVSIAIVENNQIAWQRTYGILRNNRRESYVLPTSIFEAASISKPMSALAALQLVAARAVSLSDTTILDDLVPSSLRTSFLKQFSNEHDITLNLLLSHCAGVVHAGGGTGAQQFAATAALPGIIDVIMGTGNAGTGNKAVQTTAQKPGAIFSYSGANYALVQAIIEKYSANGYDRQMRDLLTALQMTSTTLSSPAPWRSDRFARGHVSGSVTNVAAYANQAAAAASTTADDLARFVIMLNQRGSYNGRQVLSSGYVLALAGQQNGTNQACGNRNPNGSPRGNMGLGLWANGSGTWNHGGSHNGYRAWMFARPADRWGLVVLTNGDMNGSLATELFRSIEARYGFTTGTLAL